VSALYPDWRTTTAMIITLALILAAIIYVAF
jgi:hypothetical protein